MKIDDLTIGDAKALAAMFCKTETAASDPLIGKYVICRCYSAGVHAGELVSQESDIVLLKDSRRLWNWKAKAGIALSGVAANGLASGCKIDEKVSLIRLTGVCETIACTEKAVESING